jgi:2-polyprenyl-6-methoxyphenol hydroxylase-like FAD-dependent oxidoreductase
MGTTLALNGAYILAVALTEYPNDHTAALAEYEKKMRPIVDGAQKLLPGMPHIITPETAWGVWLLNAFMCLVAWSELVHLLFKFKGPPADTIPVEEYGFRRC